MDAQGASPSIRDGFLVLVVDDNRDAADTLCLLLRMWGYDCRVAYDGMAGLQIARDCRPDCVLLDIAMPGLDGCKLARLVRDQPGLSRAKLIALTAYSAESHIQRSVEAGFDFFLTKSAEPMEIEMLLGMLSKPDRLGAKSDEWTVSRWPLPAK